MPEADAKLLFVYGTLKRGCCNHPFLAGQTFLGEARTAPGYRMFSLGDYPGMIRVEDDRDGVFGEVWAVDPTGVAAIDHLEGIDLGLYRRERVALAHPFAENEVETYLYALSVEGRTALGSVWTE